ncbi:MAG: hypothetical protein J6S14_02365 [Clostridia bacterium]|nr:hypothetical protein [Clostridia bacterium]
MVLYGMFLELHDFYTGAPILLRADMITKVIVMADKLEEITNIGYAGRDDYFLVEEDYETVRGLLGLVYGKKPKD